MRRLMKQIMVILLTLNVMVYAFPMKCQDLLALNKDHSCCPPQVETLRSSQSNTSQSNTSQSNTSRSNPSQINQFETNQVGICECDIETPTLLSAVLFNSSHEVYFSQLDVTKLATLATFWQIDFLPSHSLIYASNQSIRLMQSLPRLSASNIQYKASLLI